MEKLFRSFKDFRANATDHDYKALCEYYISASTADWKNEDCPYGFSRTFAKGVLIEHGLLEETKCNKNETAIEEVNILCKSKDNQKLKQRTVYLSDETYQGLKKACDDFDLIPDSVVMESILHAALVRHGYVEE